jgi:Sulfotransferase family
MQLIIIGGAQRSGTTLLQTLLANALNAPLLPEAHILCDILAAYKRAKEFGHKTNFFYPTQNELSSFFRSILERHFSDIIAGVGGTSVLVLKDPNLIQVLDEAAALFPQCIRIVCLRDPRDITASFIQIGQRQPTKGKRGKYRRRDVGFIANKILAAYLPWMESPQSANTLVVRYEDLASEPRGTLEALARDTRLEFSLDRIDRATWLAADARHQTSWITPLEGQKPSAESVGSFKRVLRRGEVALVQRICEPIMKRFAYPPLQSPVNRLREHLTRHLKS